MTEDKKYLRNIKISRAVACIAVGSVLCGGIVFGACENKNNRAKQSKAINRNKLQSEIEGEIKPDSVKILDEGKHIFSVRVSYNGRNDYLTGYAVNNIPEGYEIFEITPYIDENGFSSETEGYDIWFKNTEPVRVVATYNDTLDKYGYYTFGDIVVTDKTLSK